VQLPPPADFHGLLGDALLHELEPLLKEVPERSVKVLVQCRASKRALSLVPVRKCMGRAITGRFLRSTRSTADRPSPTPLSRIAANQYWWEIFAEMIQEDKRNSVVSPLARCLVLSARAASTVFGEQHQRSVLQMET